ncbi:ubiquilin-1 [Drosophila innubila]|uniref:ubiquilin-1 n=1 Tax=Drosophila innubila TaxID=198719 RepID=UPI00148BDF15|nr:ubiquilin-1 [Drosophila innubila]
MAKSIDITAKTGVSSAVVSLRQNELICNLRALVAVRFEQAIDLIVLIFGGQVLLDVGTIDRQGITEGVTVHVLFRHLRNNNNNNSNEVSTTISPAATSRTLILKNADLFRPLLDDPATLREMLQSDPRIKSLIEENASFRYYLSSDRNLRDIFSTIFNPAKIQELGRKRDINIMRMEWIPGGYRALGKLNYFLRQAQEDNVALNYQEIGDSTNCDLAAENPQRGRENKMPLPNPWRPRADLEAGGDGFANRAERLVIDLKQRCDHMMKSLQLGDLSKTLQQARALNKLADNAHRALQIRLDKEWSSVQDCSTAPAPATPIPNATAASQSPQQSLNIFHFMSSNDSRWEQHFHAELIQLDTLGYTDRQRNISALLMSFGDVQTAVKLLQKWNPT